MKVIRPFGDTPIKLTTVVTLLFVLAAPQCVRAQTPAQETPAVTATAAEAATPTPAPTPSETEAAQKRLGRARALAAIGRLAAAAGELESLRASSSDDSVRDVTRVLLMAIFIEMPDYARASALLDEAFKARTPGQTGDAATHSYFALAGQTVNAVRTHLERYRAFGVNVSDASELPAEANGDLEQLRNLLERVVEQARTLRGEQTGSGEKARALDATALLEDAATVRMRIPRHDPDRAQWQTHVSEARQQLFASETRIASISDIPAARPSPAPTQTTAATSGSATKSARQNPEQKSSKKQAEPERKRDAEAANTSTPAGTSAPRTVPAGTKAVDSSPVAVGSLAGKARQKVPPSYPAIAKAARVSGVVIVYLLVNEKGEVESVERADGPQQLQQAATDAARRWKFQPTVIDGQPVRVSGYLSFQFSL